MSTRYGKKTYLAPPPSEPRDVDRWQRIQQNSLTWPKHWRKCIYKIGRVHNIETGALIFQVVPRNPAYDEYLREEMASQAGFDLLRAPPTPYLDTIEFDTLDEVETWSRVICRLDG